MSDTVWWTSQQAGVAVALGAGLLIGLERERRKGRGQDRASAGLRTFMVAALAGAVAQTVSLWLAVMTLAGVGALAALSYWRSRSDDPGLTTELALVATALIGMQAVSQPELAAACAAVLAGVLAAKERLHHFATDWLSEDELHDGLLLAALALVLLPLLPAEPLAWLGALSPRRVAMLVLLILLMQAASHLGQRLLGPRAGLPLSGLLGGFVSSTATVGAMGSLVRNGQVPLRLGLCAAVLSTAATWVQVLAMAAVVSPTHVLPWIPMAALGVTVPALVGLILWRLDGQAPQQVERTPGGRVLRLREAALVAALLVGGAVLVHWAQQRGSAGLLTATAIAALADAHAPVAALLSMYRAEQVALGLGVAGVLVAVSVNSLTRTVVATVSGGPRFGALVAGALLCNLSVVWGAWALGYLT
ncbi:DUF4010 domain-containing protein [Aquabacterium fontiphilum]|jgi:uncharacterized membrane protein (DUF4010 family)|uniref:MgtC/SapB family protein n=1 Tax=Aquabacterium fontiphilum TaxID=450365 RepID=UPI001377958D|nr:MgtC/SapB family protein [Aquabacterium fontiphilum]NBD20324.1 DUF4010 domain-containing protein [Aquabacterium fontiphilum]